MQSISEVDLDPMLVLTNALYVVDSPSLPPDLLPH